jgi:hypothetical protein
MAYSYGGKRGDNTNGSSNKSFKAGEWVIHSDKAHVNGKQYQTAGYVVKASEWRSLVNFVTGVEVGTGATVPANTLNPKTGIEGAMRDVQNSKLERYEIDANVHKAAIRQMIHLQQLDALDKNDKARFFALGDMIEND